MKILYQFSSEVTPLPETILNSFDRVVANITFIDALRDSLFELSPDDTVVFSIHTCNGVRQICECANDCGVDIMLHLRRIDEEHIGSIKDYQYNRNTIIPEVLRICGYERVYFGAEYDEE